MDEVLKRMDAKTKNKLIGALRQQFKYSKLFSDAKRRARVEKNEGLFKNGRQKVRVYYVCAHCRAYCKDKEIQVDHKEPIGTQGYSLDDWVRRAWCMDSGGIDNLQVLCKPCHAKKTVKDKARMRN